MIHRRNKHSFIFFQSILHIVVPYKKFAEVNSCLPELILSVHMFDIYKQNDKLFWNKLLFCLQLGDWKGTSRGNKQMWAVLSDISITMYNVYCIMSPFSFRATFKHTLLRDVTNSCHDIVTSYSRHFPDLKQ